MSDIKILEYQNTECYTSWAFCYDIATLQVSQALLLKCVQSDLETSDNWAA